MLKKPVILLSQNIDEVPFDLKSYRLLKYDVHFSRIEEAKKQLGEYAKKFLEKTIAFGSPVTDFYQGGAAPNQVQNTNLLGITDEDDRGFIDHLIAFSDGYKRIAEITADFSNDLAGLGQSVENATTELMQINSNLNDSSPAAIRNVSHRLAERIARFNSRLEQVNDEYTSITRSTEDSLEFVVSFQLGQSEATDSAVGEQIDLVRGLKDIVTGARDSSVSLAMSMEAIPPLERRLNREVRRGYEGIRTMAGNLDKIIASISRALKKYDMR